MANELPYESVSTADSTPQPGVSTAGSLYDELTNACCKMLDDGVIARQPRFNEIRKNEDMYNGVNTPALAGRSNIPFDSIIMRGYMDTLLAGTSEEIQLKYGPEREQDKMAADKITAVFEKEKNRRSLDDRILDMKFLASLAGRGFLKIRMGNKPKFFSDFEVCDHYDMVTEPQGGGDLDNHMFKFQMNIFRTRGEMLDAAADEDYDLKQVRKLILRYNDAKWFKDNDDIFNNKAARYAAFGIDIRANNYVGQPLYRLTEGAVNFNSKWYYVVFSREAKLWVKIKPLEEVFEWAKEYEGRGPWLSFATNRHPFIFWSIAPADDVRPVGYAMKKVVNLTIDNLEKRNWDMKAYDPKIFTEPSQLLWRPNGLVKATLKPGSDIKNGFYEFSTPDTTNITINLTQFLDGFLGKNTGITDEARGDAPADQAVGVTVSNIQQSSKRMTLKNKSYRKLYDNLGTMFDYGLYQYLREDYAVKIIGNLGVRWDELVTRKDTEKDFTLIVTSGLEDDEKNASMLARRQNIFAAISANPILISIFNKKWLGGEFIKTAGYSDDITKIALDTAIDSDEDLYAEAADSIQQIVDGKEFVPLNRNATTGFVQKIVYFAQDNYPLIPADQVKKMSGADKKRYDKKMVVFDALIAYAKAHLTPGPFGDQMEQVPSIVQMNMARRVTMIQMANASNPQPGGPGAPQGAPVAPTNAAPGQGPVQPNVAGVTQ